LFVKSALSKAPSHANGKIERWHQSLKADCIRPRCPLSEQDAARLIDRFVNHYNTVRLHSAIGYVAPADRLAGRHLQIFSERDRKLELARQNRKTKRQSLTKSIIASTSLANGKAPFFPFHAEPRHETAFRILPEAVETVLPFYKDRIRLTPAFSVPSPESLGLLGFKMARLRGGVSWIGGRSRISASIRD
jgi:hypothetical protein